MGRTGSGHGGSVSLFPPPVHRSDGGDEGKVEPAASPPAITTAMGGSGGG